MVVEKTRQDTAKQIKLTQLEFLYGNTPCKRLHTLIRDIGYTGLEISNPVGRAGSIGSGRSWEIPLLLREFLVDQILAELFRPSNLL